FLRVVDEVALRVIFSLFADDLDGVLICAHCSVGAEAIEHRANRLLIFGRKTWIVIDAGVRHVVMNADREVVLRTLFLQFTENALHHRRGKFLGGQSVPSADNSREALEWQG